MTTNIFMAAVVGWMLAATLGNIFSMNPVDAWWNFTGVANPFVDVIPVFNYQIFLLALAGIDMGLDIFTLCLPMIVIRTLTMSLKRKLSLTGIFALGFFCVISSAIRFYYTWRLHLVESGDLPITEATSIFAWNDIWAHIEACASIVTACLPTLTPLITTNNIFGSIFDSMRSFFTRWSSSNISLVREHVVKDQYASEESPPVNHSWYHLNSTQTEAMGLKDISRVQVDEEALTTNTTSIQVQKSFSSRINDNSRA